MLDGLMCGGILSNLSHRLGLQGALGVTEHTLRLVQGGSLPRPLTIAFASDFHAGPATHPAVFSALFACIAERKPDVLLLGGDFVSCRARYVSALAKHIAQCPAPLGKFAVMGNHDLWADDMHICQVLEHAGVQVLVNRQVALPAPYAAVSICGLDDPWTGQPDVEAMLHGADATRVVLMHAPDGLLLLGDQRFDVAFAGHTHGGQIARRDGRPIVVPHGPLCRKYHHGRFQVSGNGELIVSRGIGCSTLPFRLNADPELVICTLS